MPLMTFVRRLMPAALRRLLAPPYRAARGLAEQIAVSAYYRPRYRWPHPVLVVIGPPRSGTQLMAHLLAGIPGYRLRDPNDPDRCTERHDVCEAVFARLPRTRYSVLKLHTAASPSNLAVLDAYRLPAVVMIRDFRDECVSRYFAVLHYPRHRHHQHYHSVPKAVGLSHCLDVVLQEYVPWVRAWLPIAQCEPQRFCLVRFEELRPDPGAALTRVLNWYGFRPSDASIQRIIAKEKAQTRFDLKANVRDGRPTVRKGIVGDWRNHLTEEHIQRFKEGCGEFLIELGYERDFDWTGHEAQERVSA
ncbi:MAG: sulfotransferase domain-containing protein [Candidatus Omnitrophica bacterium]|nr:sulfotransferase domain-containing protein [Candidatus Omnitrophota bacterium]